ncbi:dehypoxanthine futalosine cyclase [Rubrobacter taiwanensis]|jgi:cyclic dehypoxanthinyl futalosine synthase|uniref:Cyclic dehypoxanthine futalosine synthase n=1 Tax=Rubrobacter taiwanensis TaxID=185139 RepID=A0A4R1BSG7_9ACTN|nr:cyclic dehypoxanthinyl futalosine synthase [Rubrobacter taiwanensis]TCJ20601.1 dehypoxanthine futalosine cyclase [Rubrobacter taiwanensis]
MANSALLEDGILDAGLEDAEAKRELARLFDRNFIDLATEADAIRRELHPNDIVTYIVDRNINYTNVCWVACSFCAFYRTKRQEQKGDGYTLSIEQVLQKIQETVDLGGTGILMQGGLHPDIGMEYTTDLIRAIRREFPQVHVHALSPAEIWHLVDKSGLSLEEVLRELKAAGLMSIPGGGAEILTDETRRRISPAKNSTQAWMEVMETWHSLGMKSTATMMFGIDESYEERIEHLLNVRKLQARTGGFTAFIDWVFQPDNTTYLKKHPDFKKASSLDYLKTTAIARIVLDNIPNIQASWVTQPMKTASIALHAGCNDMGSIMIEENVVKEAGAEYHTTEAELRSIIERSGFRPAKRSTLYDRSFEPGISPEDF